MSQNHIVKLKSTKSKDVLRTRRNKKSTTTKLTLKKYDKTIRKRVLYKEMKK